MFPAFCINCAAEASQTVRMHQLFTSIDDDNNETWEVSSVDVPLCSACAAMHTAQLKPVPLLDRLWPAFRTELALPLFFSGCTALFFVGEMMKSFLKGNFTSMWVRGIPVAIFTLIAYACWLPIRGRVRRFGLPPPTTISDCFTFSTDRSRLFEPSRRRFQFRNQNFAEAFVTANQGKLWDRRSPQAASALTKRTILYGLLIVAAVLFFGWSVYQEWFM